MRLTNITFGFARWKRTLFWLALSSVCFLSPYILRAQATSKEMCLSCHGVQGLEKVRDGKSVSLYIPEETLSRSAHGALECVACHADISEIPHASELQPPQCSSCHADASRDYAESVHGTAYARGAKDVATCSACHGNHNILPAKNPDSQVYPLNLPRTCGGCHGDPELAKRHSIPVTNAYQLYMDSIHGQALTRSGLLVAAQCLSCHGSHRIFPASDPRSTVHRTHTPDTCGNCHVGVLKTFTSSIHGREAKAGNPAAPVCANCHTAHQIKRVEMDSWKLEIVRECGTCHAESLRTYRDTFHGQVTALGFTRVARCSDCHGSHDILAISDPDSSVAPSRIVGTCRKCHSSANASFVKYDPHADPHKRARNPVLYYTARFMTWLLAGVFGFFGLHTILWAGRSFLERHRENHHHSGSASSQATNAEEGKK
ncbi:MAG: hypothetical protein HY644_00650 [Acidobacteria bacterium]|nr:hypothetical protein [Acidobacteriota bacterium]